MNSDSQDFEVNQINSGFFEGLCSAPKLTQKEKLLRNNIREESRLETSQTTLQHKIQKRQRIAKSQGIIFDQEQIFKQKVIVEQQALPKKKKNKQAHIEVAQGKQKSFQELRLIKPLQKAVAQLNYKIPTPIQQIAIPVILSGKDVVASSITGSGKTAAFLLPILQRYFNVAPVGYIRALIVTPTRQLAIQIYEQFQKLNKYIKLDASLVIGANSIQKQEVSLRNNPEVIIATPGRLIDLLLNYRSIGIENLQILIFDEADKLLELGFQSQVKEIMKHCNPEVQTILFSATVDSSINRLAKDTTRKPIRLSADPDNKTAQKLHQQIVKLKEDTEQYRQSVLLSVLNQLYKQRVIVFFKTKRQCHRIAMIMGLLGLQACELHGNLSQSQRTQAFLDFKEGKFNYLLATDLAARGLDIKHVKTVVNFQLPTHLTKYIHRIGRTARAGSSGTSLTLCNDNESLQIKRMSKRTGDRLFKLTVNEEAVQKYRRTIAGLGRQITAIIGEQMEERELRKAEMELKKLENLKEHQGQIYSRPKKEWFVTEKEKKDTQQKAREETGEQIIQPKTKKIFKRKVFKNGKSNDRSNARNNGRSNSRTNQRGSAGRNNGRNDRNNGNRNKPNRFNDKKKFKR